MNWPTIWDPLFSGRLCMTLVHSIWQVALLAAVAWCLGRLWRRRSLQVSYVLHVAALVVGLAAMPMTFALLDVHRPTAEPPGTSVSNAALPSMPPAGPALDGPAPRLGPREGAAQPGSSPAVPTAAPLSAPDATQRASIGWVQAAPWIVAFYLAGVVLMLVRLVGGTWRANRLGSRARLIDQGALAEVLNSLTRKWSMRMVPALAQVEGIFVPKVVGLVRPMILLPVSLITCLSTEELAMILAHELAHVRRYDMWVNLAQRLAETVLFFNPALWYLSRRVSALREYCCDELTCQAISGSDGDLRTRYASALLRVVELGRQGLARSARARTLEGGDLAALAAGGRSPSDLRRRIARLFGEPIHEPLRLSRGGMLMVGVVAAVWLVAPTAWHSAAEFASVPPASTAEDAPTRDPSPIREGETDVHKAKGEYSVPITVFGRAKDKGGKAIAGAKVYLASERPGHRRLAETKTDGDGRYRFASVPLPIEKADTNAGLDSGSFEVFGIAEGYGLAWRPAKSFYPDRKHSGDSYGDPRRDQPPGYGTEDPIELDLSFGPPKTIRGRIVNDRGEPIPGTEVAIRYCDNEWDQEGVRRATFRGSLRSLNEPAIVPPHIKTRLADADGRFEFTGLPAGYRWSLDVRPPGHPARSIWAVTRKGIASAGSDTSGSRADSGDLEVVFAQPRKARFRVVYGDTGKPAPGVGVGAGFLATTDETGLAEGPLPDGRHKIFLIPRYGTPYLNTEAEVVISADSVTQPTTLRLRPAAVVDISVVDADSGKPLSGADVWLGQPIPGASGWGRVVHGYRSWEVETRISHYEKPRSDASGKMRVLFEPGQHRIGIGLEAFPAGYEPVEPDGRQLDCRPGKPVVVQFKMRKPPAGTGSDTRSSKSDLSQTPPIAGSAPPVDFAVVVARHVLLLGGREIVTWAELEKRIAALPDPSQAHPHFYITRGAHEAGVEKKAKEEMWRLHQKFKLKGHSEGSLWPRADLRYDRIETAKDLVADESLRVKGRLVDGKGQPVAGAEVLLMAPVDKSIPYKTHHIALVEGHVRNPIEEVLTHSDAQGHFSLYPPKGVNYYVVTLHPRAGFNLTRSTQFIEGGELRLLAWTTLVSKFAEEAGTRQEASLRTRVPEADGFPEIIFDQYWVDLKKASPAAEFRFTHVPPIFDTTLGRDFPGEQGGSYSLPGATVGLMPGETRRLDLAPLSDQQREHLEWLRKESAPRLGKPPAGSSSSAPPAAASGQRFELQVVGPDGKPIPSATVEIRTRPKLTAQQVALGQLLKQGPYGTFIKTGADGRMAVAMAEKPNHFSLSILQPGFGPYWGQWGSDVHAAIPSRFTAELDAAWTVGGLVVTSAGAPIEGAMVHPSIEFKKRPGDFSQLGVGQSVTTDARGRWSFANVPVSMKQVFVAVNHPDYQPNRRPLTRAEFGVEPGGEPKARITLQQGLVVSGSVRDEAGQPIAGATVRTKFLNDIRQATTGPDGRYRIVGCEPRMARIVVSAAGKAMDLQEVRVEPGMKPVDFTMKPGGKIRIRVLDDQGKPVAKTRIFFQRWRGPMPIQYFEFDHVNQYTDPSGVWQWDEAPLDEIKADVCPPGGMQIPYQSFIARNEEYVVHTLPALIISGTVVDAETKTPVKAFRVVPGLRGYDEPNAQSGKTHVDWARQDSFVAADGRYRLRPNRDSLAHLVRIEADGYQVAVSRDIKSNEGQVQMDFALLKAKDIAAKVLTPDGRPAAGAKLSIGIAGSQISITNGEFDGSTYAARCDADADGRFRFPMQAGPYQLVILHPSGFAHLKSAEKEVPSAITLTAWARAQGTFFIGPKPVANVPITINTETVQAYGDDVPHIFTHHDVTTGPDGRFLFDRVFPGDGWIGRRMMLMVREGATEVTSSKMVPARFIAGQATSLDLGGTGRAVTGRLAPPKGSQDRPLWNFALVNLRADLPTPKSPPIPADVQNQPERQKAWWSQWKTTAEGKAWQAAQDTYQKLRARSPHFTASIDREGSFRIDDVPPGKYLLDVQFHEHRAGYLSGYQLSVPEAGIAEAGRPLELGVLALQRP